MKFSVQVIVHPDDDTEASPMVREVFTFDRDDLAPDTLGLQLAEAKDLLAAVQDTVVEQQVNSAVTKQVACPDCGRARRHKDTRTIVVRSLFGALQLASPRCTATAATSPPAPSSRWPGCCPSGPPGAGLPAGPLHRPGLLRHHRGPAGRAAAAGPTPAPGRGPPPDPGRGPAPGRRARLGTTQLHRHLPA